MEEINVEKIMERIREEIKEKGYKESDLSFNDIPIKEQSNIVEEYNEMLLKSVLHATNCSAHIEYYQPTGRGIKSFIKRVIRKVIKPVILPLCNEQEKYNSNAVQTMNQMYQYIQILEKRIGELEENTKKEK